MCVVYIFDRSIEQFASVSVSYIVEKAREKGKERGKGGRGELKIVPSIPQINRA